MTPSPLEGTVYARVRRTVPCVAWHAVCVRRKSIGSRMEAIMKNGPISAGVAGPRSTFTLHSSPFTLRKHPALCVFLLLRSLRIGCKSRNGDASLSMITGDADYSSSEEYDVKIVQAASPMSFPKADRGSIDVNFEITIKNLHQDPVTIDRISLQSISGSVYRLDPSGRQ